MQNTSLNQGVQVATWEYDFSRDGGTVGDIDLSGQYKIPSGAVVLDGMIWVKAAVTSAGSATVALKLLTAEDVLAATAKASLTLNALIDTVPVGTAATAIRTTTATGIGLTLTVGTAALTAGKIAVSLRFIQMD